MILAPVAPIGCPSAQAPPLTLTFRMIQSDISHRCHGDAGKRFIDLIQIDGVGSPAEFFVQRLDREDRGRREPLGLVCESRVTDDRSQWLQASLFGF